MRLELSRFVESDLDDIAAFIAMDNPRRAVGFVQEIRSKLFDIQRSPLIHQLRPEIGEGARMATLGRYVILFRVIDDVVRIERVAYGGRDLVAVFDSR
jgi:toxin ParE1/3/4